ncbi:MAG: NUDIX hydrolase [Candidatus Gastranaerophilales bacterium]|nr:NUDIX hydrolase [Candidatus Gastranaerophilales bacterium]
MENLKEKQLNSQEIYSGKVFRVTHDEVELANDYKSFRDVVHHNGGVVIVAEKDNKILMVQQYRYATKQALYELPAGKLDKQGEDVLSAAKRELEEETGYNAQNWESLGYIWTSPGFCSEKLYLFKASNLTFRGQHLDEGEILNYLSIEKDKVFNMIKTGEINDAKTICALMRAYKI